MLGTVRVGCIQCLSLTADKSYRSGECLLCAHSRLFEVDFGPSEFGHYHTRYSGPIRQWISPVLLNRLQYRPASENKDVKHPGYTNDYKTRQTIPDVLRDEDHKQYRIE